MYLKALEIQGFKSFPDKTVLNFGEDVTAIVGPNGSGKSNISDAIRWVMGEQSAKGLRGSKMEDVIFGGTARRSQVGFAQVTLVLDNTEHIFPSMEENEVSVTRRYYRSGESEYYIDRQSVRLRDVMELFMDTGLGKEGYSMIGQGKIDEILSTKSGDRREIFEEAAGISRFRHRKEESERKLERTEENLVRINDKISELELQVTPLKAQAETAKKFLILRDELRLLEISVWLEHLDTLKVTARKLEADFRAAQQERDAARAALDELYAQGERYGEEMRKKDIAAEELRSEASGLESKRRDQESAVAVLENNIAHQRENIARATAELQETENRTGSLQQQAEEQSRRAVELEHTLEEKTAALDDALAQAQAASEKAGSARERAESLRTAEALALSAAADAKAEAAALEAEAGQVNERRVDLREEQAELERRRVVTERERGENLRALEQAKEAASAAANAVAGQRLRLDGRQKKAAETAEARVKQAMDTSALDDRIRLLSDMAKDYEGFNRAVRAVMQSGGRLRGIHGPVANLMKTDSKYSLAIEIALGAALQNIVVDREEDAKSAISYLKQRDAGRATFLPLTAIRGEELRDDSVSHEFGFVGLASRLVRFDGQYQNIFFNLLGRTVVVEDLDCGIAIARKYRNAFRIVTLDGQVINRGGSMTGGSVSRGTGVLSRSAELDQLKVKATAAHQALEAAKEAEDQAARELAMAQYDLEVSEGQRREAEDAVLRLTGEARHFDALLESVDGSLSSLKKELDTIEERAADGLARAEGKRKVVEEKEGEAAWLHKQAEEAAAGQTELLEQASRIAEAITAQKTELASLTAERESALERAADLHRLAEELSGDREQREKTLESFRESIQAEAAEIARRREAMAALEEEAKGLANRLSTLNNEKLQLEAKRTAQNRESQEMNENLLNLERSASRLEQKINAGAMEEKQIIDRLWETYELSHSDAQAQRQELESVPKANRRIAELKREIHALGSINLGAIEQFEQVNARYTYLTDQRDDVEKAKADLLDIIAQITERMTEIFTQQFQLLAKSFQATFVELFGGGTGRLELEDEKDVLNCGIDIKAQPPGKTLKTISLLSGGEKAFVAIALYFSILKVHPTPFVVMDEIEAALDDANVTRYARYMRNLTDHTQFIVITHRRGTMEEADVLYGVTMQEQGVSKILTINLNDMAKDLQIE
ncbi:MAG: chromosome segregation protein SMC [Oscillibacter sp.]|nr:chromosome segregation protein SMC [Oscillibacter sp.]